MADLQAKEKMTPAQLGLVITSGLLTARLLPATSRFVTYAEQFAWLSSALAGLLFYAAVYMMIRLGEQFPQESLGEYLPRLLGRKLAAAVFCWFIAVLVLNIVDCTTAITELTSVFLFDRTPQDFLALILLLAVIYGAMQEWGTILRVIQLLFISLPGLYAFYSLVWLNFEPMNLLPLWPDNWMGILQGVAVHTEYFAGYEAILVLLPLTARGGKMGIARAVWWGYVMITLIYVIGAIVLVGSISAKTIQNAPQPVIYGMKSVELPGTFIERLENYMILLFIPVTYFSMVVSYFAIGQGCQKYLGYKDHRVFIPLFLPAIFFLSSFTDTPYRQMVIETVSKYLGLIFSFGIIPLLLSLVRRKKAGRKC